MNFNRLYIGDTFCTELDGETIKFIKIEEVVTYPNQDPAYYNAVCIDEYNDRKGILYWIEEEKSCIRCNYS